MLKCQNGSEPRGCWNDYQKANEYIGNITTAVIVKESFN